MIKYRSIYKLDSCIITFEDGKEVHFQGDEFYELELELQSLTEEEKQDYLREYEIVAEVKH